MEREITSLLSRLDEHKKSHPNISSLWREYIIKKHASIKESIITCNNVLEILQHNPDLTTSNIITLYAISLLLNNRE